METIDDIVADIRAQNQGLPEDGYALSPYVHDLLRLADRIEAAMKAECEESHKRIKLWSDRAAEPLRNCEVDGSKIKSESDFEKAFNLHKVSQCCSMCRYGDDEVGCTCTCRHPYRNDNGNYCDPDLPRIIISNTMQNYVCDLFEERT